MIWGPCTVFNGGTLAPSIRTCTQVRAHSCLNNWVRFVSVSLAGDALFIVRCLVLSGSEGTHSDYTGQGVDQLAQVIETIKKNPNDRRIIMSAWNPAGKTLPFYINFRHYMQRAMRGLGILPHLYISVSIFVLLLCVRLYVYECSCICVRVFCTRRFERDGLTSVSYVLVRFSAL
jgi:hypothetical protein